MKNIIDVCSTKVYRFTHATLCLVIVSVLIGCTAGNSDDSLRARLLPPPTNIKIVEQNITREDYRVAAAAEDSARIRLVPITRSARDETGFPEYRLFSIVQGSPYALLGLKNGDVLVTVQGYTLVDSSTFAQYAKLLISENEARLIIRRSGEMMELRTKIVDSTQETTSPPVKALTDS